MSLWGYLNGQVIVHSTKGEGKDESGSMIVLNYASVEFLFDIFAVTDRKNTFRKLHAICDVVYNGKEVEEEKARKTAKNSANSFMMQLMGTKK